MLSRVADSIYWMNRYMERAESVARFADVNLYLALDLPAPFSEQWDPVIATTGDDALFRERYGAATRENVLRFLTCDEKYPSSILSCLRAARENARQVREVISSEMWEQVNKAYLMARDAANENTVLESPHDFFSAVKLASNSFVGVTYVTMTHNEGWHFGRLGRLIERADKTSRIVDVKYFLLLPDPADVGSPYDEIQWSALLKSASAFEMYRKRFGRVTPACVVDFLLLDPKFPRSIRYCVGKGLRSLHAITGGAEGSRATSAEALACDLREELDRARVSDLMAAGLHQYLDAFQTKLNDVGAAVHATFFAPELQGDAAAPA